MSDAIDLLERLGQDAKFHGASADKNANEVEASEVEASVTSAILAGDAPALRAAMGQTSLVSLVMPAEEEGEEEREGDDENPPIPQAPSSISCG